MSSTPDQPVARRTALVTGGARRLGRATCEALARHGLDVLVHYHHSRSEADDLATALARRFSVRTATIQADLEDPQAVDGLWNHALARAGAVDVLINNASIFPSETVWDVTDVSLRRNLQIHAWAPLRLALHLARQKRPGQIVNLLDSRVTDYDRRHVAYHLSKRSLLSLTRLLALELAPTVRVNAVAPGLVLPPVDAPDTDLGQWTHTTVLQRHGGPEDVTRAILYLLESDFVTGQVLYVDGGRHLKGRVYE